MLNIATTKSTIDDWVTDNAERFDPTRGTGISQQMAFSELTLYLYVAQAVDEKTVEEGLHEWVYQTVNSPRYRKAIRQNRRDFLNYSFPVFYAKHVDRLDPATKRVVDKTLDGRSFWANERIPCRQMELWHFCKLYGYPSEGYDPDHILKTSLLENPPHVIDATLEDSYALTHDVFFLCNFGIDYLAFPDPETSYDLETEFTGLILRYLADDNRDLALELLLAGTLIDQFPKFLIPLTLLTTLRDVDDVGYVQGPSYGRFSQSDLSSMNPADRAWASNYHATLVGGTAVRILDDLYEMPLRAAEGHPGEDVMVRQFLELGNFLNQLADGDRESAEKTADRLEDTAAVAAYPELYALGRERLSE